MPSWTWAWAWGARAQAWAVNATAVAELARRCAENGITFIGPAADVLELAGNKVQALGAARAAGIPVLDSTKPSADVAQLLADAESMEYPLFVKAVAGGGGRGMRRVAEASQLEDAQIFQAGENRRFSGADGQFIDEHQHAECAIIERKLFDLREGTPHRRHGQAFIVRAHEVAVYEAEPCDVGRTLQKRR